MLTNWLDKNFIRYVCPEPMVIRSIFGLRVLHSILWLGFIDKEEGMPISFKDWHWDFWRGDCRWSIWHPRYIHHNPFRA